MADERSWLRRLMFTPVGELMRGRVTGVLDTEWVCQQHGLSPELLRLVRRVSHKTWLMPREQLRVINELSSELGARLARGESAEAIVASFGKPRVAAKRIRREKIAERPRWLRAIGAAGTAVCYAIVVLPIAYLALGLLLLIGEPRPTGDALRWVNTPAEAVPEADRAWPLYRRAIVEFGLLELDESPLHAYGNMGTRTARPGNETWPQTLAFLEEHRALLALFREAAGKRGMGYAVKPDRDLSPEDRRAFYGDNPPPATPPSENAAVRLREESIDWLPPRVGALRAASRWLALDALRAAEAGDGERVLANVRAIVGVADHARESRSVTSLLVGAGIASQAAATLAEVCADWPGALSREQWVEAVHLLASLGRHRDAGIERWVMTQRDLVERLYTPGGRITDEGLRWLLVPMQEEGEGYRKHQFGAVFTLPMAWALMASGPEMKREIERRAGLAHLDATRPLWARLREPSQIEQEFDAMGAVSMARFRFMPLNTWSTSLHYFSRPLAEDWARNEATQVAIALEIYRRDHGGWPSSLDELVPRYVHGRPIDHSTGLPLLYRIVEGRPLLYGRGLDDDDDLGVMPRSDPRREYFWPRVPDRDGDWVLFPPVIEPAEPALVWDDDPYGGYENPYASPPP